MERHFYLLTGGDGLGEIHHSPGAGGAASPVRPPAGRCVPQDDCHRPGGDDQPAHSPGLGAAGAALPAGGPGPPGATGRRGSPWCCKTTTTVRTWQTWWRCWGASRCGWWCSAPMWRLSRPGRQPGAKPATWALRLPPCWRRSRRETPRLGFWLDNSRLTVEESVEKILEHFSA